MSEEITVTVVEFSDRRHYQMQWRDPHTGAKRTKSTGVPRTGKKKDREKAERIAGDHETALREGLYKPPSKVTWGEFRERYETEVLAARAGGTLHKMTCIFNTVEAVLRLTDDSKLAKVPDRLSFYQAELRTAGRSEDTIRGHLAYLKAAFRWAADVGLLAKAPKVTMPTRTKGGGKSMKGRPVTGEEFERMLGKVEAVLTEPNPRPTPTKGKQKFGAKAREKMQAEQRERAAAVAPTWKHLLRGLWLSGLRLGEAMNLYWDRDDRLCAVDLSGKRPMLHIPAELEKGHQDRLLPITPDFVEFLRATPEAERTGPVFNPLSMRSKSERCNFDRVSRLISAIGKAAGVKVDTDPKTGKVKYASAHDLRRAFGERWALRVMPQVLMELMRHESIETTLKYYVGINAERTADAVWEAFGKVQLAANSNISGNNRQFDAAADTEPSDANLDG